MISKPKWGMASDTLRYSLIEQFGGVYADLNFIFHRDVTDETYKYDFFSKAQSGGYFFDNYFFAAARHHPVIKSTVELVYRNLVHPPKYIADFSNQKSNHITDLATAYPLHIAYYKNAHKDGNIDVIYPGKTEWVNDCESFLASKQGFALKCPESGPYWDFNYMQCSHELCGSLELNFGEDSPHSKIWQ